MFRFVLSKLVRVLASKEYEERQQQILEWVLSKMSGKSRPCALNKGGVYHVGSRGPELAFISPSAQPQHMHRDGVTVTPLWW